MKERKEEIYKEEKKEVLSLIILNNGLVIKCKKEDIPSILSSQYDD